MENIPHIDNNRIAYVSLFFLKKYASNALLLFLTYVVNPSVVNSQEIEIFENNEIS
jgi:hypothetical protein